MRRIKQRGGFVLCVQAEVDSDLLARKVYQVLPDPKAAAEGFLRVIDESGEDYLYPAEFFVPIELPQAAKRRLTQATEALAPAA